MSLNLPNPEQSQIPFEQLQYVIVDLCELSDLDIFTVQKSEAGHTSRTHEYENGIYVGVEFDDEDEFVKAVIIDKQDKNIFIIQ